MGQICDLYDGWEYYIARSELEYNQDHYTAALNEALLAKKYANTKARQSAIGIFIAKCYTALGEYEKSSQIYRRLIKDGTYLPPIIMGLMYNHLEKRQINKAHNNITIVKLFNQQGENDGDA